MSKVAVMIDYDDDDVVDDEDDDVGYDDESPKPCVPPNRPHLPEAYVIGGHADKRETPAAGWVNAVSSRSEYSHNQ